MRNNIKKASAKCLEVLLYFQHFMQILCKSMIITTLRLVDKENKYSAKTIKSGKGIQIICKLGNKFVNNVMSVVYIVTFAYVARAECIIH